MRTNVAVRHVDAEDLALRPAHGQRAKVVRYGSHARQLSHSIVPGPVSSYTGERYTYVNVWSGRPSGERRTTPVDDSDTRAS